MSRRCSSQAAAATSTHSTSTASATRTRADTLSIVPLLTAPLLPARAVDRRVLVGRAEPEGIHMTAAVTKYGSTGSEFAHEPCEEPCCDSLSRSRLQNRW